MSLIPCAIVSDLIPSAATASEMPLCFQNCHWPIFVGRDFNMVESEVVRAMVE
jgi:hypothetical protein